MSTPAILFGIGSVSWLIAIGVWYVFVGNYGLDIQLHDIYFVIGAKYILIRLAAFFALFSGIYYWFPKLFGRTPNKMMGTIHFWISITLTHLIFWLYWYILPLKMSQGYKPYLTRASVDRFEFYSRFVTMALSVLLLTQLLFLFNLIYSAIRKGKEVELGS